MADRTSQIDELRRRVEELRARMPKHSAPPAMMIELDELEEEELASLLKEERD